MNHRADGPLLPENAWTLRLNDSGLLGNGAGKRFQENTVLVRGAGRTIKFTRHTSAVSWITDIYFITLVMCHYSASSSEARQALLPEKLELIRAGGASFPGKKNKVWKTTKQRFTRLSKAAAAQGPIAVHGQVCSGYFVQLSQRPNLRELNKLKMATSAV